MGERFTAWKDGYRAALSFTFDDARPSQLDTGIPILDEFDVRATFYVSAKHVSARIEEWREVVRGGHEIGNHTFRHPCSGNFPFARGVALEEYTIDRIKDDIAAADRFIEDQLGVRPTTFAYPCGQTFVGRGRACRSYVPVIADRFLAGRGYRGEIGNDPDFCDLSRLDAAACDNTSYEELIRLIDSACTNGSWLVLCGHEIGVPGDRLNTGADVLRAVIEYVRRPAAGIWIAPVASIASYLLGAKGAQSHKGGECDVQDR